MKQTGVEICFVIYLFIRKIIHQKFVDLNKLIISLECRHFLCVCVHFSLVISVLFLIYCSLYLHIVSVVLWQLGPSQPGPGLEFLGQQSGLGGLSDVFGLSQSPTYVPPQEVCMSTEHTYLCLIVSDVKYF